tara:strand:+ start:395 stop:1066 length:672 start_codon:yes stop_codon:yes gene_type:complete
MGIQLSIDQDLKRFDRFLNNNRKQLPFATSLALNDTGFDMRQAFNKGTLSVFHKPTTFTQKAFLTTKSKKTNLVVHVFAKDKEGSDAARYLRFGVQGGARPPKGFERYFSGLPNDKTIDRYFMPTRQIKRDGKGNITRATLKKLSTRVTDGTAFIGTPRNSTRPPGLYVREKNNKLLAKFITTNSKPTYTGRFNIEAIAGKVVQRRFNQHFDKAMSKAIATAK